MDINEVKDKQINRHPWELSRTKSVISDANHYIELSMYHKSYINIGAGDMFFDYVLMNSLEGYTLHAVDIGYERTDPNRFIWDKEHIVTYKSINEIPDDLEVDYAVMMDSLEYIDDESQFLTELLKHICHGGYIFFTLPAIKKLYSEHDVIVGNLRRYDKEDFKLLISKLKCCKLVEIHSFYTTLFVYRFVQNILKLKIDPEHKVTTGWPFKYNNIITRVVEGILNADYWLNRVLGIKGHDFPGLSIYAVIRKD